MKTLLLLTTAALLAAPMMADAGRRAAVKPEAAKKTTAAQAALQAALTATSSFGNCALTSSALVSVGTAGETAVELASAALTTSPALVASNSEAQPVWSPPVLPSGGGFGTTNPTPPTPTNPATTDAGTVIVDTGKPPTSTP